MFDFWYNQNLAIKQANPNWMMLVTSVDNWPDARVVLLKDHSPKLGFVFFTNYNSLKSKSIQANNKVSLVFFWNALQLQIRISGKAKKTSRKFSQTYFDRRPVISKIGAWTSLQSEILPSRSHLEARFSEFEKKFANKPIPCPDHWGGWHVMPHKFEFWKEVVGRLHERIVYRYLATKKTWQTHLLYP